MNLVLYSRLSTLGVVSEEPRIGMPLTLLCLIALAIFLVKEWVFFLAVAAGILLDSLTFRFFGANALFFLVTIGTLFLYQKKFETHHMFFGVSFTILASSVYLLLFEQEYFVSSLLCITFLSLLVFGLPFLLQQFS